MLLDINARSCFDAHHWFSARRRSEILAACPDSNRISNGADNNILDSSLSLSNSSASFPPFCGLAATEIAYLTNVQGVTSDKSARLRACLAAEGVFQTAVKVESTVGLPLPIPMQGR